jgi:hypothetical protein
MTSRDAGPWTAEVQHWYERWLDTLVSKLQHYFRYDAAGQLTNVRAYSDDELQEMRAWYAAQPHRFCQWIAPLEQTLYQGEAFDTYSVRDFYRDRPHWTIDWDALLAARDEARTAVQWQQAWRREREGNARGLEREAKRYPTLDDFLARGLRRSHAYYAPLEPDAVDLLPEDAWRRLQAQRERLPRHCRDCGKRLTPKDRYYVRCEACRPRKRVTTEATP